MKKSVGKIEFSMLEMMLLIRFLGGVKLIVNEHR